MASILSATPQLTKSTVLEFYFRRFKRILPNYLFVIFALLCVSIFLMHPLEYAQLIFEAFSSIFFFSNYPGIRPTSYFDMVRTSLIIKSVFLAYFKLLPYPHVVTLR
jgi:peptidoglycan/LPS O-acetylase OafA/YrhL